jgi:hypothetical protein
VAVTVYVCEPVVDVSRWLGELEPLLSVHELSAGPLVPREQLKLVDTACPRE